MFKKLFHKKNRKISIPDNIYDDLYRSGSAQKITDAINRFSSFSSHGFDVGKIVNIPFLTPYPITDVLNFWHLTALTEEQKEAYVLYFSHIGIATLKDINKLLIAGYLHLPENAPKYE